MFDPLNVKTLISLMLKLCVSIPLGTIYIKFWTYSVLQRHHIREDTYSVGRQPYNFRSTPSGLSDHDTSGKDRQHTSSASSRKTLSFYLKAYSGFYCRTQIPSSAFFLQPSFSIIFSYNQPVRWYYKDMQNMMLYRKQQASSLFMVYRLSGNKDETYWGWYVFQKDVILSEG